MKPKRILTKTGEINDNILKQIKEDQKMRIQRPAGYYSNEIIRQRNGGIRHQFEDDIGGCSANYK